MIIERLTSLVPEFFKSEYGCEIEGEGEYVVMGHFAQYMRSEINKTKSMNDIIERCVRFINEMSDSHENGIPNLMIVGFFEVFADEPECIGRMKKYFNQNSAAYLQDAIDYWQKKDIK